MNLQIRKAWRFISDKEYRFLLAANKGKYDDMPDDEYLRHIFKARLGYELNLDNPRTFNEKLQWLKLYDRKPIYTTMVDKYAVKDYVAGIIGQQYIIPTLGVWNDAEDIDFANLPEQFVLKCTHDSQGVVICKDKKSLDIESTKQKLNRCLKRDFYKKTREWPYKDVPHRIIAEEYLEDSTSHELRDYKFFCFGGTAKCFKIDFDRFIQHRACYFSPDGRVLKIGEEVCPPDPQRHIEIPISIRKMKTLGEELSKEIPFLRADFYDVDGRVYFGELTFYPASGFGRFIYDGNDEMLGSWLEIPQPVGVIV